ncbi:MAG TPA: ABC transporter permease [Flavitalea sp.]|nr:ABC transporter permease [Flavitalea sp.]
MATFKNALIAETIKMRRTPIVWLILGGALFIPLMEMLIFLFNPDKIKVTPGENEWLFFIRGTFQFASVFIIPVCMVLATSLLMNIENKSNTWKHILILPITRNMIYAVKMTMIMIIIVSFYLFFLSFVMLDAMVLKLHFPQFGRTKVGFEWEYLFELTVESFLSILAIVAIHIWLSFHIRNVIVIISIGLVGLFLALVMSSPGTWNGVRYVPYAYPALFSYRLNPLYHYPPVAYNVLAAMSCGLISTLCYLDYRRNFRG